MAQNLNPNRSDNRGGKRENSGRKATGDVKYQRVVTEEEKTALDEFLIKLRKVKK
jgi:hypothetical protein